MSQKKVLLTAGYAGHDQASFLAKMKECGVGVVIDVRQNPVSRKKGFSRSKLSEFLATNEVEYVHESKLGVPAELRERLKSGKQGLVAYFHDFREYLVKQVEALDRVYDLATTRRCCLLCLEHLPAECHRSVVAEAVVARNGHDEEVRHL